MEFSYFELNKKIWIYSSNIIANACVWTCALCDEVISGMGGPGRGEICTSCGDKIKTGTVKLTSKKET